ncbi:hypothetical protein BBI01_03670 [Chryseobacterium artocarpi]|uniref:FRG domain-containing protein n=1 Tax=Chryseobacterium artocarpi TaxID=1414727 RepID=A0A1B9A122_9FLAO|nr:FRG domain-containing protein [Chryseobacterium artocarpi]OCA77558.1 hypothetical protein BBI01_03670 [Chryseobacterium artocarpi]
MEDKLFLETEIHEWRDIFKINEKFIRQFVFRGQGDKNWTIVSSLERLVNRIHPNSIDPFLTPYQEQEMIKEFQWKSKLFNISNLNQEDYIEWLSIMQHYGASTRLVDFTDSFFIAAHMAIYESGSDSSIWCINKNLLTLDIFDHYRKNKNDVQSLGNDRLNEYSLEIANQSIQESFVTKEKRLLLIRPKSINERLYRQQGLFLMSTNIQVSFMENLQSLISNSTSKNIDFNELINTSNIGTQKTIALLKINIPRNLYRNIIANLKEMNIHSELLFPGIEGLAKSLNYSNFNS